MKTLFTDRYTPLKMLELRPAIFTIALMLCQSLSLSSQIGSGESIEPTQERYAVVKVILDGYHQLDKMVDNGIEFDHIHGDISSGIELYLTHEDVALVDELGINYKTVIPDYAEFYESKRVKERDESSATETKHNENKFGPGSVKVYKAAKPQNGILSNSTLTVYPNPASDFIILFLNKNRGTKMVKANIITNFGTLLKSYKLDHNTEAKLDISFLDSGESYLVMMLTEDGEYFIEKFWKR